MEGVHTSNEGLFDHIALVRDDLIVDHFGGKVFQEGLDGAATGILPFPLGPLVADGQDGDLNHHSSSTSMESPTEICPGWRTSANIPSRGITQSPIW